MRWAGLVAHIGEMRNAYKILVRKPERKRREDNVKTNREIDYGVDWILLVP
jgi:hypothetical protein